jgi:hypothetical protein
MNNSDDERPELVAGVHVRCPVSSSDFSQHVNKPTNFIDKNKCEISHKCVALESVWSDEHRKNFIVGFKMRRNLKEQITQ